MELTHQYHEQTKAQNEPHDKRNRFWPIRKLVVQIHTPFLVSWIWLGVFMLSFFLLLRYNSGRMEAIF